jgi:hypothetical protein
MQAVLTQTYCTFCEVVANVFLKISDFGNSIARARAAHALSHLGYYEEAKKIMLEK